MNEHLQLYWQLRHGRVIRWHTEDATKPQLDGQHCWGVATILLQVMGDDCSRALLVAALRHDQGEGGAGDVPAPAKWAFGSERLDIMEALIRQRINADYPALSLEEAWALKMADTLEGMFWTLDEMLRGNQLFYVIWDRWMARTRDLVYLTFPTDAEQPRYYRRFQNAYEWLCWAGRSILREGQSDFLSAIRDSDLWKPASAMELRRDFENATGPLAGKVERQEPPCGSMLEDPAIQADSAADTGALQEAIDDRYIA